MIEPDEKSNIKLAVEFVCLNTGRPVACKGKTRPESRAGRGPAAAVGANRQGV